MLTLMSALGQKRTYAVRQKLVPPLVRVIDSGCVAWPGRIKTPARPSRRSIGGQGLRGCLRPSRPAKWGVREGPLRSLPLRRRRFQSRLSCCLGGREEILSHPRLCQLGAARQFSLDEAVSVRRL